MRTWRTIIAAVILLSFGLMAIFGLLVTSIQLQSHHHAAASTDTCPFLPGEQAHCVMNFRDHLSAWGQLVRVTPIYKIFLLLVCVVIVASRMPWLETHTKRWVAVIDLPPPSASFFATTIQPRAP